MGIGIGKLHLPRIQKPNKECKKDLAKNNRKIALFAVNLIFLLFLCRRGLAV